MLIKRENTIIFMKIRLKEEGEKHIAILSL